MGHVGNIEICRSTWIDICRITCRKIGINSHITSTLASALSFSKVVMTKNIPIIESKIGSGLTSECKPGLLVGMIPC